MFSCLSLHRDICQRELQFLDDFRLLISVLLESSRLSNTTRKDWLLFSQCRVYYQTYLGLEVNHCLVSFQPFLLPGTVRCQPLQPVNWLTVNQAVNQTFG